MINLNDLLAFQQSVINRFAPTQFYVGLPLDLGTEFSASEWDTYKKIVMQKLPKTRHLFDQFEEQPIIDTAVLLVIPAEPRYHNEIEASFSLVNMTEDGMKLSSDIMEFIDQQIWHAGRTPNPYAPEIGLMYAQQVEYAFYSALEKGNSVICPNLLPRDVMASKIKTLFCTTVTNWVTLKGAKTRIAEYKRARRNEARVEHVAQNLQGAIDLLK